MATIVKTEDALRDVLYYHNESVVKRVMKDAKCTYQEALGIFEDTKRFLYLCGNYSGGFTPSPRIDDGWHAFILHTKDYYDFCIRFFKKFIHHYPNTEEFDKNRGLQQIRRTLDTAYSIFGCLSANWNYCNTENSVLIDGSITECSDKPCDSCSPDSNCQSE